MIQVKLSEDRVRELKENVFEKWGFQKKADNQVSVAMQEDEFQSFLRTNDLILYKNHIKSYQNGEVYGEFSVD